MESQSSIAVAFSQNPALAEYFAEKQKKLGDVCKLELEVTINELSDTGAVLGIEALVPEGYEVAKVKIEEPKTEGMAYSPMMGSADATIPSALAARVQKKA